MAITIKRIAELAGVSPGTVDRALHNRGRVNPQVAERIKKIAAELNYKPNTVAKGLKIRNKNLKIAVILHIKSSNPYFDDVIYGINQCKNEISDFGITVTLYPCPDYDAEFQLTLINQAVSDGFSAIIIVPINHPLIRQRINELHNANFPVVLLTNLIDDCRYFAFVGCNYKLSGEIAAGILNMIHPVPGNVMLFSPRFQMLGHMLRAQGMAEHLLKEYPDLTLLDIIELTGDDIRDYQITIQTLNRYPDIDCFVCPGAYSRGNLEAIREQGYFKNAKIICYDTSDEVIKLIKDRIITATIVQRPRRQGYIAVKILFDYLTDNQDFPLKRDYFISTKLYFYENISDLETI